MRSRIENIRRVLYSITHLGKPVVNHTPLQYNERLSTIYNANVYLKREDLQTVRSFKIRGALSRILSLTAKEQARGIVCASAGNHAQGVALACNALDLKADIFVPATTPLQKQQRIEHFGNENCTIHKEGKSFGECLALSVSFAEMAKKSYVHPYNHMDTILGQGTVGAEIMDGIRHIDNIDINDENENIIVVGSVGGGGLMAGIGMYFNKNVANVHNVHNVKGVAKANVKGSGNVHNVKGVTLIGVEPDSCPSFKEALCAGKPVSVPCSDQFVDGASVPKMGSLTFDLCRKTLDNVETVSVGKVCETMLDLYQEEGIVVEPAGALAVAALEKIKRKIENKMVVCIVSGGNHDVMRYPEVVERALVFQSLKHYYLIEFNQTPGELRRFVNKVLGPNDDITRFEYIQKTRKEFGTVLVGIQVQESVDEQGIRDRMDQFNFIFEKVSPENGSVGGFVV